MALLLPACKNNNSSRDGVKFSPAERTSSMSSSERQEAISAKKAEITVDYDALLATNGIKYSVIHPEVSEDVPAQMAHKIGVKAIQVAALNGVAATGTNPTFVIVTNLALSDKALTGTAPQKAIVKYLLTLYIANTITEDIYAACEQTLTGVGQTFEEAANKAVASFENNKIVNEMFLKADDNIIKWYEENIDAFKTKVNELKISKEYALAASLLSSVPAKAATCYAYASDEYPKVMSELYRDKASELLIDLKGVISSSGGSYLPEAAAYMKMIPQDSPCYKEAKSAYDAYLVSISAKAEKQEQLKQEREAIELAEARKQAEWEREASMAQMKYDCKVKMAEARSKGGAKSSTRGNGILGLGKLFDNCHDFANRVMDEF